jgi:decaprenylphospho-beta-D-ribofuranose 2-oxidase
VSFDGGVRRTERVVRPDRYRALEALPADAPRSVRGGGYSYAAASFGAGVTVVDARAFDRLLAFDEASRTVECEAGTTLGKLHAAAECRGFYLPVQPGYPRITVGGCIAGDVHGKNHHRDGSFRHRVRALTLFHPAHGVLSLSRERDGELFDLTCGGLGLTGQILTATLALEPLPARTVAVTRTPIGGIAETAACLRAAADADLVYTWHDFGVRGAGLGRGFLYAGRFAPAARVAVSQTPRVWPLDAERRRRWRLPLFGRATTRAFNAAYGFAQAFTEPERALPLFDFLFPVARKVVYFEAFGAPGLHEYQVLLPEAALPDFAERARSAARRHGVPVTLASCKLFRGEQRLLRFDGTGVCLALDFPRSHASPAFAAELDEALLACRGIPNVLKDSRLPRAVAERAFPELERFRERLRTFDPKRLHRSELSERLGL